MKVVLLAMLLALLTIPSRAQILQRLGDRAKQKAEQKAGQKIDKAIDETVDGKKKAPEANTNEENNDPNKDVKTVSQTTTPALTAYSRYDFIQGEKVVAFEDFSNEAIGDFPARWNTNGSAEVVTINARTGKWLKISSQGFFLPEFISNIPENSTLEFDLGVNNDFDWGNSELSFFITHLEKREKFSEYNGEHKIHFGVHPIRGKEYTGVVSFQTENGETHLDNQAYTTKWDNKTNLFAHFSIWRQGQRFRLYVNGDKLLDLPRAFQANSKYTDLLVQAYGFQSAREDYWLLGNIRLAVGAPDTRNKLVTEGRFVTTGITFDVNSDKIKAESYGVLKEIAAVLKDNPELKIRIIGHTDSDGDAAKNMDLSKRRAAAVKDALVTAFAVEENRITTDGLGASKPVADNKAPEGKAQNRRVEFLKL